ncbi:hypothetical protein JCM10213_003039 [Rhodosporidiobolus nylandii]
MTMRRSYSVDARAFASAPLLGTPATSHSPFTGSKSGLLRSRAIRAVLAGLALLLTFHTFGWLRWSEGSRGGLGDPDLLRGELGEVEQGRTTTFRSYLRKTLAAGDGGEPPRLWLTVADRRMIRTAAPALEYRVRQLNAQRRNEGLGGRKTQLVILCADRDCVNECHMRQSFSCYGGYASTRPLHLRMASWMKLSGIIDALEMQRDVLYSDPEVALVGDPYPVLDPAMDAVDFIAMENATNSLSGQLSSNYVWSRSTKVVIDLWTAVLDVAIASEGRPLDEILNSVLKTEELRRAGSMEGENHPNWVGETGVRVHVLNKQLFRSYHPWTDVDEPEDPPILMQLTCAGDLLYSNYIAKAKGFVGNFDSYYSVPPKILQLPAMVGSRDELKQLIKIAIVAAKMTGRALQPPATATFLDVLSSGDNEPVTLSIYAAFPLPYLAQALQFDLVEPSYVNRAYAVLNDASLIRPNSTTRHLSSELKYPGELDLRSCESIFDLVRRLKLIAYTSERVVRLSYLDSPRSNWREWNAGSLPKASKIVQPCRKLEKGPTTCGEVCRLPASWKDGILPHEYDSEDGGVLLAREMAKRIEAPWPPLSEFLTEGGWSNLRE